MPETLTVQPYDVRNQFLVSSVRPPEWANPEPAERYNLVVLGAGTASLCLMPNHFHLAVWPRRDDELSDYMLWLLTAEVRRHQQHYHSSGHVWQACFRAFATTFSSPPFPPPTY